MKARDMHKHDNFTSPGGDPFLLMLSCPWLAQVCRLWDPLINALCQRCAEHAFGGICTTCCHHPSAWHALGAAQMCHLQQLAVAGGTHVACGHCECLRILSRQAGYVGGICGSRMM